MIKFEFYSKLEDAFEAVMTKDLDHVLIRHNYPNGTRIYPHKHNVYEWVIATHGHFTVESEGETKEFNLTGEKTVVIHYPAGMGHGLTVLGKTLEYFVMRD